MLIITQTNMMSNCVYSFSHPFISQIFCVVDWLRKSSYQLFWVGQIIAQIIFTLFLFLCLAENRRIDGSSDTLALKQDAEYRPLKTSVDMDLALHLFNTDR